MKILIFIILMTGSLAYCQEASEEVDVNPPVSEAVTAGQLQPAINQFNGASCDSCMTSPGELTDTQLDSNTSAAPSSETSKSVE